MSKDSKHQLFALIKKQNRSSQWQKPDGDKSVSFSCIHVLLASSHLKDRIENYQKTKLKWLLINIIHSSNDVWMEWTAHRLKICLIIFIKFRSLSSSVYSFTHHTIGSYLSDHIRQSRRSCFDDRSCEDYTLVWWTSTNTCYGVRQNLFHCNSNRIFRNEKKGWIEWPWRNSLKQFSNLFSIIF